MDYKKLVEDLNDLYGNYISELCGNDKLNCADLCIGKEKDCVIAQAISAIENLLKERDKAIDDLSAFRTCKTCIHSESNNRKNKRCEFSEFCLGEYWEWCCTKG